MFITMIRITVKYTKIYEGDKNYIGTSQIIKTILVDLIFIIRDKIEASLPQHVLLYKIKICLC